MASIVTRIGARRHAVRGEDPVAESVLELAADLEDMASLARRTCRRIDWGLEDLGEVGGPDGMGARFAMEQLLVHRRRVAMLRESMLADREVALAARPTGHLVHRLAARKTAGLAALRTARSVAAACITAADWQSPSFAHSVHPQAGRFRGRVTEHHDDYRRDRHDDAARFEAAFLHEYVDHPAGLALRALMTSCGMSAFTTILGWLLFEVRPPGPVLLGRRSYHECRDLVLRAFPGRVVEVDERHGDAMLEALARHRPGAVFLDTLCNASGIDVPDIPAVVRSLAGGGTGAVLVLDNTGRSCTFQPFALVGAAGVRLVVHESLTKYAQLGLDRVAAGMVVAGERDGEVLDGFREHLGTNVSDLAPHLVPDPDRAILERRLTRLGRNAEELAIHMSGHPAAIGRRAGGIRVVHPALPSHPAWERTRDLRFRGGYLEIDLGRTATAGDRSRLVRLMLEEAERLKVPLVAGASFGFDVARVYVTAADARAGIPFVRVAAGTEHRLALEELKASMWAALDRL